MVQVHDYLVVCLFVDEHIADSDVAETNGMVQSKDLKAKEWQSLSSSKLGFGRMSHRALRKSLDLRLVLIKCTEFLQRDQTEPADGGTRAG